MTTKMEDKIMFLKRMDVVDINLKPSDRGGEPVLEIKLTGPVSSYSEVFELFTTINNGGAFVEDVNVQGYQKQLFGEGGVS
jgi:hypothetical protein